MAVAGEQILTRLGFEVDGISLKSSLEKAAAFGSALRRAFADASAAFVGVAKGEAEVAAQADALGVSVERFAEWRFIAEQTGASSDALGASLKAMLANNPGLSDAASELERAGGAMREMGDAQREAYARGLGIDPSLIPMLTRDVSGLRDMFRSLYATAGTDAAKAAEDGKGFLDGMARLAGLCDLLAKTVALSLLGTARSGIEALGDAFVAHFDDIRRVLELVVALASAAAPVIGAALGLLVSWGGQLAGLLGTLDADLFAGIGKGIAAFMALRGAVGAAIIGFANLKEAWALLTAAFSANPYLLAVGAAVTLAVVVMDNWGAVKAFLLGVWDAVASGVRAAVDAVASAFDNAVNFVTGAGSAIAGAVGPAVSSAMGFAGAVVSGAADLLASAFSRRSGKASSAACPPCGAGSRRPSRTSARGRQARLRRLPGRSARPSAGCGKSSTGSSTCFPTGRWKSSAGSDSPMRARRTVCPDSALRTPTEGRASPPGTAVPDTAAFPPGTVPPGMLGGRVPLRAFPPAALGERALWAARLRMALSRALLREAWVREAPGRAVLGRTVPAVHSSRALPAAHSGALREAPDREGRREAAPPARAFSGPASGRSRSSPPPRKPT